MRINSLILLTALLTALGCSKDEPEIGDLWIDDDWGFATGSYPDYGGSPSFGTVEFVDTPKGKTPIELVKKEDLPAWLQSMTDDIAKGYIMRATSGDSLLYFIYDSDKAYGRYYDDKGNPSRDNPKLKDWEVIYRWGTPQNPYYPYYPYW